jgi:hypothetical protein
VLSSFRADPHTFVQRVAVALPTGEEAVLTFTLGSEEEVVPQYRSMGVRQRWVLRAIRGEPNHSTECPTYPTSQLSPELVVQAQLKALQDRDFTSVFAFASPANKVSEGRRRYDASAQVQSSRAALPYATQAARCPLAGPVSSHTPPLPVVPSIRSCGGACERSAGGHRPAGPFHCNAGDRAVRHTGGPQWRHAVARRADLIHALRAARGVRLDCLLVGGATTPLHSLHRAPASAFAASRTPRRCARPLR